jgi:hypothetical protein
VPASSRSVFLAGPLLVHRHRHLQMPTRLSSTLDVPWPACTSVAGRYARLLIDTSSGDQPPMR